MPEKDKSTTIYELNLIMLLDNSGAMMNGEIEKLNNAISDLMVSLFKIADEESVKLKVRVIAFNDYPNWFVGSAEEGVDIHDVKWNNLEAYGCASLNKAVREACKALKSKYFGANALRPIVVIVTNGYCDPYEHDDYLDAIAEIKKCLAGISGEEKIIRIAVGVEEYDKRALEEFASRGFISGQLKPLVFEVEQINLADVIKWATVTSVMSNIKGDEDTPIDMGDPDWN